MANLSQYFPFAIAAGTTAGTYAAGDSAAHKGLSNTFTQNQTFSGTNNTAPSQTSSSGASLMTRDLVDSRALVNIIPAHRYTPASAFDFRSANSGGSSYTSGGAGIISTSASVLSSTGWAGGLGCTSRAINANNNGAGGGTLRYDKKWAVTFTWYRPYTASNTSIDFRISNQAIGTTPLYTLAATEVGCGFKLTNVNTAGTTSTFTLYSGNGTAVSYNSPVVQSIDEVMHFRVYNDGVGTVSFSMYKLGSGWVSLGSVARPVSGGAAGHLVLFAVINNGSIAENATISFHGITFTDLDAI